jgi:exodeoxyribonuclease V alpha subunit
MELDQLQQEAIANCCDMKKRVWPVTGPAGSGKTTILKKVYELLVAHGYRVVLVATTGKAAKRIFEATGIPAITVHRLLEYTHPGEPDPRTGKPRLDSFPRRDRHNPVEFDVVLADEYAMVNHELHRNLFDALPPGGIIRVFGDVNQLKPIEENKKLKELPTPFENLLATFTGTRLSTIHRQGEGSGIVQAGAKILARRIPSRADDFIMNITDRPVDALLELVLDELDNHGVDFSKLDNQVLTQQHGTWIGTVKLNGQLQNLFRPEKDGWVRLPRHDWAKDSVVRVRNGDKVIYNRNNYTLGIYNGETGIVVDCSEFGEVVVDVGDREVVIPPSLEIKTGEGRVIYVDPRKDLDLAYVITPHKAQGSEYKHVIYMLNKSTNYMQGRSNFYTGITRAREKVFVITDQRSLSASVFKE